MIRIIEILLFKFISFHWIFWEEEEEVKKINRSHPNELDEMKIKNKIQIKFK